MKAGKLLQLLTFLLLFSGVAHGLTKTEAVSLDEDLPVTNNQGYLSHLNKQISRFVREQKNDSLIITYLESSQHNFSQVPEVGASIFAEMGVFFESKQAFSQAIKCRKKELFYHRLVGANPPNLDHFFCLGALGGLYQSVGKQKDALHFYERALQYAKLAGDPFMHLHAYNNLGVYYLRTTNYNQALSYFNMALAVHGLKKKREVEIMQGIIHGNLANALFAKGQCRESVIHYEKNLASSKQEKEFADYVQTAVAYAKSLNCLGKNQQALSTLLEAEQLCIHHQLLGKEALVFKEIFSTYLLQGNLAFSKIYWEKYNTAFGKQTTSNQQEYTTALESLSEQQVALLEADKTNQELAVRLAESRMQRVAFIGILLILISVIVILIYQRRNREMIKKAALEKVQKELLAAELKNKELLQKQLDFELKSSKKDVTTLAIDLNQHEEIRKTLVKNLKEIQKAGGTEDISDMVGKLISDLNNQLHSGQSRALFNENITKVNSAFFETLSSRFPSLSKSELEFCGLLRLKLSSKEISTLKNISPDSAKVIRHRIRKKLGIGSEADIYKALEEI